MTQYHKIYREDLAFLRDIVGEKRFFYGADIGEDYYHDELSGENCPPEVLLKVKSAEEVSRILSYAGARNIPVTPRGQGTGLVGGAVAKFGGILLDLSAMNRILELDRNNLLLTVEPGVLLMEIAAFVEAQNLFYPPDPGEKTATIGGNISTNAGGMRAVKYGVTRDYVRELEAVLPSGEIVHFGGKVAKNSSGYSMKDLLIGSEGTLAVITRATLRLLPLPRAKMSLLVPFSSLTAALAAVPEIVNSSALPTAVEFMTGEVIKYAEEFLGRKFPDRSAPAYLLITLDSMTESELDKIADETCENALSLGALDVFISKSAERNEAIWTARGAFLEAIKASTDEMDECDVVLPRDQVAALVEFRGELEKKYSARIPCFGHAGDGNLHIYLLRDNRSDEDWKNLKKDVFDALYSEADRRGGKVSGEHGIGMAKKPYLAEALEAADLRLQREIKKVFDPGNILNPGKVIIE